MPVVGSYTIVGGSAENEVRLEAMNENIREHSPHAHSVTQALSLATIEFDVLSGKEDIHKNEFLAGSSRLHNVSASSKRLYISTTKTIVKNPQMSRKADGLYATRPIVPNTLV